MDIASFVEGPLLKVIFTLFALAVLFRVLSFIYTILKNRHNIKESGNNIFLVFIRAFLPFHRATPKRPFYSSLRYAFHVCLFAVPIWLAGHITLWEESFLGWSWISLPGELADLMTLVVIGLAIVFIIRHFAFKEVRENTTFRDYIIILIAVLPFVTGYFLVHGTLDAIPFFSEYMWTLHILSGEIMIVGAVFLFCRTRIKVLKCTGCASCVISCPTCTLESRDSGNTRLFNYSHYQCICCGSCVNTCPENAAELRHEIDLKKFFKVFSKEEIRSVELESCERCGALFVPEPLMEKIKKSFADDYLKYCSECRKINLGSYIKQVIPKY